MYYVTMTDRFMSGWGRADGKINKLVISCDTYDEAAIVEDNARCRSEMKYVNICINKPYYTGGHYLTSYHGREQGDYETWFKPGAFA